MSKLNSKTNDDILYVICLQPVDYELVYILVNSQYIIDLLICTLYVKLQSSSSDFI